MKYLVDANVLSEATQAAPSGKALAWLEVHEKDLLVDSIVLGEIYLGVLSLPEGRRRERLTAWFDAVAKTVVCLPWDAAVGRRWARLVAEVRRKGFALPVLDSMIAATALEHGLTVATRNLRDFRHAGVKVVDPFAA